MEKNGNTMSLIYELIESAITELEDYEDIDAAMEKLEEAKIMITTKVTADADSY